MTEEEQVMQFLRREGFEPILGSRAASNSLKQGVRYTIMRMEQLDAEGMVRYYWSAISGTDKSIRFADQMRAEGFARFEEVLEDFRRVFNQDWLRF